ncbi:MAG: DUF805 domain-containing protein [Oscillospiraceae bacterium]|nr:DUF805 domain-containing protein [Oscillospiraceae bacterium]
MEGFLDLPFVKAALKMIANFSDFKGRASRSDYWWAYLAVFLASMVFCFVFGLLGVVGKILLFLYELVLIVPSLSLCVRRLHDTGKSGWWLLLSITGIGAIVIIIFLLLPGDSGDNQFGSDPKLDQGV